MINGIVLVTCDSCDGTGIEASMHGTIPCIHCDKMGISPIPFSELYGVKETTLMYLDEQYKRQPSGYN